MGGDDPKVGVIPEPQTGGRAPACLSTCPPVWPGLIMLEQVPDRYVSEGKVTSTPGWPELKLTCLLSQRLVMRMQFRLAWAESA